MLSDAYTLIPVTSDYVSAKMFLNSIDPYQIDNQGTNIAAAIDMATKSFSEDKKIGKAIILITDAEDLEDRQSVMDAAKTAAKNDIQLDVVGLGFTTPVPIPIKGGGYLIDPETASHSGRFLMKILLLKWLLPGKGYTSMPPTRMRSMSSTSNSAR